MKFLPIKSPVLMFAAALALIIAPPGATAFLPLIGTNHKDPPFTLLLLCATKKQKDNSAMAFLRSKGLVGEKRDYRHAIGIDEGPSGSKTNAALKRKRQKAASNSISCAKSGIVDDCSTTNAENNNFPMTCSGTEWMAFSDRIFGGKSSVDARETGHQENIKHKACTVLKGDIVTTMDRHAAESTYDDETAYDAYTHPLGFIQLATSLHPCLSVSVDLSHYRGVEVQILARLGKEEDTQIGLSLKTPSCKRFSAYRAILSTNTTNTDDDDGCGWDHDEWHTIQVPWSQFEGYGIEEPLDPSVLKRIGIFAAAAAEEANEIDHQPSAAARTVLVAVSKLGFYH